MARTRSNIIAATFGDKVINDTSRLREKFFAYYISSESVIEEIEVNGVDGDNVVSDYFTTPLNGSDGGVLLTPLINKEHQYFSGIKLTSGKVIGIR